jgi:hypothetical protein
MEPSKNSRRAAEIGCGLLVRDAAHYDVYTHGFIPHPPCVAMENVSGSKLTVGIVAPAQNGDWEYAVTTVADGTIKPLQSMMELELVAATAAYATRTLTISSATSGAYYLITCNIKDAPSATTTLAIAANNAVPVINGVVGTGAVAHTFTAKGVTNILVKATATTVAATLGDGISAHTDGTTPTFKAYRVTAWGLAELNLIF